MPDTEVPDMDVTRLPLYLRTLAYTEREGLAVTSSQEIAAWPGLGSAQVRKGLSYFGRFGKQGTGYDIAHLRAQLKKILRVDCQWAMALLGADALGQAIMHYGGFRERGFYIACVFDSDSAKQGEEFAGFKVLPPSGIPDMAKTLHIKIGIVAVPSEAAQEVADGLVKAGVRAILNYAPISLTAPPGIQVQRIDPVAYLLHMAYYLDARC